MIQIHVLDRERFIAVGFLALDKPSMMLVANPLGTEPQTNMCLTSCVCCRPIYSGRRSTPFSVCERTSRDYTERTPTNRSFYTSFPSLLCLPSTMPSSLFITRGVKQSFSLVDRKVKFLVPTIRSLSTLRRRCVRRILHHSHTRTHDSNRQMVMGLPSEPPWRPATLCS